ncbi:unnamed protein product [Clonostachys rosea f. rosea IK726]|uniref:Uncharacterized protein n=2 Tax=Bionectria ochroleuca TaxID=29856 RepID=A0A0B7KLD9_BIOOC|nr:unnamed protein product [Clonostachys rosea f. rosea IK726]
MHAVTTPENLLNRINTRKSPSQIIDTLTCTQYGTEVYQLHLDEGYKAIIDQAMSDLLPIWKKFVPGKLDVVVLVIRHVKGLLVKAEPGTVELIVPTKEPQRALEVVEKKSTELITQGNWSTHDVFFVDVDENDAHVSRGFAQPLTEPVEYISIRVQK